MPIDTTLDKTQSIIFPDISFSATAQETIYLDLEDSHDPEYLRINWILVDGKPVFDPILGSRWKCPKCGESGVLEENDFFNELHGAQHADGPFDSMTPLELTSLRCSELPAI